MLGTEGFECLRCGKEVQSIARYSGRGMEEPRAGHDSINEPKEKDLP